MRRVAPDKSEVVITVHGIRTHGRWQKSVSPILASSKLIPEPHDYGRFGLVRFARRSARDAEIERFRAKYETVIQNKDYGLVPDDPARRPSVVAHSLGAYIVGHAMRRHPYIRLDKLILCGSILSPDFDWSELFARDQLHFVRNLRCLKDPWVPRAHFLVPDAGNSGVAGFSYWGSLLEEVRRNDCAHSDFFSEADVREDWIPFLKKPPSRYRIVHSRSIESDPALERMLDLTHAIDDVVFQGCEGYGEQSLPRGLSREWTDVNRDLYTFLTLRDGQTPVGYVNAMPVKDACFDLISAGEKTDNQITGDDVVDFAPNSVLSLYLMSIAIAPAYRRGLDSEGMERLLNAVIGKLVYYATHKGVRVRRMAAVRWTTVGGKLCERLGMRATGSAILKHDVFAVDLEMLAPDGNEVRQPGMGRLIKEYERLRRR